MRYREFIKEAELSRDQKIKINRINQKLQDNPPWIDEIWNTVSTKVQANDGKIVDRIWQFVQPENTKPETDQTYGSGFVEGLVRAINKCEGTVEEKIEFANTLGQKNHIDTKALLQTIAGWDDWLVGTPFSRRLFDVMFNDPAFRVDNKGPGEFALAILSPNISLSGSKGDITVDGQGIEVKGGLTSSGGRLTPTKGTLGSLYNNKDFWSTIAKGDLVKTKQLMKARVNANNYSAFLTQNNLGPAESTEILSALFTDPGAQALVKTVGAKGQNVNQHDLIKIAVKNYGSSQGDDRFLIVQKDIRTSIYFHVDDLDPVLDRLAFSLPMFDPDARSQGKAQIGILKKSR